MAGRLGRAPVRAPRRPQLPPPLRPRDRRDHAARRCATGSLTGARVRPDGDGLVPAPARRAPGRRLRGRAATSRSSRRRGRAPPGRAVRAVGVPEPARPAGPGLARRARRARSRGRRCFFIHGGPTSVDLDRWSPGGPGVRRHGLLRRDAQLPRLDRVRRGVARRARSATSAGRRSRTSSRATTTSSPRASPIRRGPSIARLVVGRLPHAADARACTRSASSPASPACRSRTTSAAYARRVAAPPGLRPGAPRRRRRTTSRSSCRSARRSSTSTGCTAPLLLLAGENDSRCPLPQILNYVERLKARDHPHELYLFGTGHSSFDIDERIRQLGVVLDFLSKTVPGVTRLAGRRGDSRPRTARRRRAGRAVRRRGAAPSRASSPAGSRRRGRSRSRPTRRGRTSRRRRTATRLQARDRAAVDDVARSAASRACGRPRAGGPARR